MLAARSSSPEAVSNRRQQQTEAASKNWTQCKHIKESQPDVAHQYQTKHTFQIVSAE